MNDPKNKLGQYAGLEQLSTQALEDLLQQDFAAGEDLRPLPRVPWALSSRRGRHSTRRPHPPPGRLGAFSVPSPP